MKKSNVPATQTGWLPAPQGILWWNLPSVHGNQ